MRAALLTALAAVVLGLAGGLAGALTLAPPAGAHSPASTLVRISLAQASTDASGPVLRIVAEVALQQLDIAYGSDLMTEANDTTAEETVAAHANRLRSTFLDRVRLTTPEGTEWPIAVQRVSAGRDQGQDAVRVVLLATGPVDGDTATAEFSWQVVTDVVVTHNVYVGGVDESGRTELLATLTRAQPTTTLTVEDPGAATEPTMWAVGFRHFREGADHLLFLSLVALGAARRRLGWARTLRRLALLTLTFTVGHSASLALATLGLVSVPSRWVEVAIAATILLAAAHAVRPRLAVGTEVAVTGAFGLIHGFGFAGTLTELSLHGTDLLVPLLTFNLGLEAAQLAALVLVIVPLLVIARSRIATRMVAGVVAAVALSWIVQRAFDTADPLDPVISVALASPERLAAILGVVAIVVAIVSRRHRARPVHQAVPVPAAADLEDSRS
ncbi:MAG: HupE/UreJ family protein [Nocardioides sp.]|uniref:HupE/UreJ family protein n=1 Tax=Nocardioides sp. TaxID=35761 RepID=UPI0039E711D8